MKDYKVGDTVVFVGKAPNYKHVDGRGKWIDLFESLVGKSVEVMREKDKVGDYHVYYREGDAEYWMNEAWLTPQFKAGDRVIIHRPETEEGRIEGPVWMDYDMNCYDGKMFTIRKIMQDGHVVVDSMGFDYHFHPRWLELVEDEPQKFAVGDLVKVTKPTENKRGELSWIRHGEIGMIDGLVGRIEEVRSETTTNACKIYGGNGYWYDTSWLTLVEKAQPKKEKSKRGKFETLCNMANYLDFGIFVEEFEVMAYITLPLMKEERRTKTFRMKDRIEPEYKNAYKWLLENALEMSESFKEWYNGRD